MPTKYEQITALVKPYKDSHDELTLWYYVLHSISKEDFELAHEKNWKDLDQCLIDNGLKSSVEP